MNVNELSINYLLIAALIALIIGMVKGYRKGFLRLAVSVAGLILVVLIVTKISPYVSDYLINHTTMYNKVRTRIVTMYENKAADNSTEEKQNETIISYQLPDVISNALISNNKEDTYTALAVTLFEEYIAGYLAKIVIKAGSFVGLFIVLAIAQLCLFAAIKILEKIPVLKTVNRMLGMGLGIMMALLFIWVFFVASLVFFGNSLGNWVIVQVNNSRVLSYLFNNNLLFKFIL